MLQYSTCGRTRALYASSFMDLEGTRTFRFNMARVELALLVIFVMWVDISPFSLPQVMAL